ncbi:hypothetical protein OG204_07745 [Streptomyces sp. NBC_01387]|uniref:hypothetical protein n=1 Tax=unclassified Streptomyces TaxID=2593676 RepID=UPI002024D9AA|nr:MULTISPECIES: hypothetical protein [unclassified Streptomyces]MCX4551822.1 hypothetical protein [Streptomyces sp. NBC_01500]WSC23186.1 hypothetical protein OIE60_27875 [Streptomyces sp. NBC_01766]WSV57097.1 hypothetical protein OG282_27295 [Streptomyces sp. NBC_01014]
MVITVRMFAELGLLDALALFDAIAVLDGEEPLPLASDLAPLEHPLTAAASRPATTTVAAVVVLFLI